MRRAVDVGIGIVLGVLLTLLFLRGKPAPQTSSESAKSPGAPVEAVSAAPTPDRSLPVQSVEGRQVVSPTPAVSASLSYEHFLRQAIGPARNAEERTLLIEILSRGTEEQRCSAAARLGLTVLKSRAGDTIARAALEKALKEDDSDQVKAISLRQFWYMPDDGFGVFVDRLVNGDDELRLSAMHDVQDMILSRTSYAERLRGWAISEQFTHEQVVHIAEDRRLRVIKVLGQMSGSTGRVGEYAAQIHQLLLERQ